MHRKQIIFVIVILVLSTLACGKFHVKNNSPYVIAVKVTLPEGSYGVKRFNSNESASWDAFTSGIYYVEVLRDEAYVKMLQDVQQQAMEGIFSENNPISGVDNLIALVNFFSATEKLEELEHMSTSSCSGKIPDDPNTIFEKSPTQDIDVTVEIKYDVANKKWSCSEQK